jgi:hypothetical protein
MVVAAAVIPAGGAAAQRSAEAAQTISVSTAAQLIAALKAVKPGETIALADGTYTGAFVAKVWGTASQRITLTGSRKAILSAGSITAGYGLSIQASYWNITGLSVTGASKGIMLDGATYTIIDGVDVGGVGAEAVHFRKNSSNSTLRNSNIHDTGLAQADYGEGVYIGSAKSNWTTATTPDKSDAVQVLNNTISNTTGEGIDVKEGTTGGVISGNRFTHSGYSGANFADSWVDVKGNGYQVTNNTGSGTLLDAFQVHLALSGWGNNNVFRGNGISGGVPGYEVWVEKGITGTVVGCKTTTAPKGLSNIACVP